MAPEKTGQKQDKGKWAKGQSGNPDGRPRGARNKATLMAQSLLRRRNRSPLTRKCIQLAMKGQPVALRLCMERILPPAKERPIQLQLQAPRTLEEVLPAMNRVLERVADSTLGPQEGSTLMGMLATTQKTLETLQLEQRIKALESILQSRKLA